MKLDLGASVIKNQNIEKEMAGCRLRKYHANPASAVSASNEVATGNSKSVFESGKS